MTLASVIKFLRLHKLLEFLAETVKNIVEENPFTKMPPNAAAFVEVVRVSGVLICIRTNGGEYTVPASESNAYITYDVKLDTYYLVLEHLSHRRKTDDEKHCSERTLARARNLHTFEVETIDLAETKPTLD